MDAIKESVEYVSVKKAKDKVLMWRCIGLRLLTCSTDNRIGLLNLSVCIILGIIFQLDTASCQEGPVNTAVNADTPVSQLNCSTTMASSGFSWNFSPVGSTTFTNIISNCQPIPGFPQYGTSVTGTSDCNLLIKNANTSMAGTYQCSPPFASLYSAQFIVLGSGGVTCSSAYNTNDELIATCNISYSGEIAPNTTWYQNGTAVSDQTTQVTDMYSQSQFTVDLQQSPNVSVFYCEAYFTTEGTTDTFPSYRSSCTLPDTPIIDACGCKGGWIAGICICSVGSVGNIIVIALYGGRIISCTIVETKGCRKKGLYICISASGVLIITGVVIGSLIIEDNIHVANIYKGVQGLIGGFTIALGLLLGTTTTVLFYAFGCTDAGIKENQSCRQ